MNDAKFVKNEDPFTLFSSLPPDYQFFHLKTKSTPRFFSIPLRYRKSCLLIYGCPVDPLYSDGDQYCFMNTTTYGQEFLTRDLMGDSINLLKENTVCNVLFFEGRAIGVALSNFVDLRIVSAEQWAKGDTAAGSFG